MITKKTDSGIWVGMVLKKRRCGVGVDTMKEIEEKNLTDFYDHTCRNRTWQCIVLVNKGIDFSMCVNFFVLTSKTSPVIKTSLSSWST